MSATSSETSSPRTTASSAHAAEAPSRIEPSAELKELMRRLKLGRLLDTLPERLALARTGPPAPRASERSPGARESSSARS
jgi:hypothetical protein